MFRSYDIFLSHSGAQKGFVEHLYTELKQYERYSVFFDKDSIKHGEPISPSILEYANTCKLAVAVLSEEYFTRSKHPMMELAASYTAAKGGNEVPCLLPVFLDLKPEHAKNFERHMKWLSTWEVWKRNEIMSDRSEVRTSWVQPSIWKEALDKLLDTRGPIYKPHEYYNDPAMFSKEVARVIAENLDEMSKTDVSGKMDERMQLDKNGGAHEQEYAKLLRKVEQFQEQARECSLRIARLEDQVKDENAKFNSRIEELQKLLQGQRDRYERLIAKLENQLKAENANSSSRIKDLLIQLQFECTHYPYYEVEIGRHENYSEKNLEGERNRWDSRSFSEFFATQATPHWDHWDQSGRGAHPAPEGAFTVGNEQNLELQLQYGQGTKRNQNCIRGNQLLLLRGSNFAEMEAGNQELDPSLLKTGSPAAVRRRMQVLRNI